jgi:hypothetical protein
MKKWIRMSIIAVMVAGLLTLAIPVLGAYIGSLTVETTVREPTAVTGLTEVPVEIDPGMVFTFDGEVWNDSSEITYGMVYHPFLFSISPIGEEIEVVLEEIEDTPELKLWADAKGGPQYLGTIAIYVDGEAYLLGEIKNLPPRSMHKIKAEVKTHEGMATGQLIATIGIERRAPL